MARTKAEIDSGVDRRKATPFTPEQIDKARHYLGRYQYNSAAATELTKRFGLTIKQAYRLLNTARELTYKEIVAKGDAADPLTAQYLFLQSIVGDQTEDTRDRLNASKQLVQLLGLEKLFNDDGDVLKFLTKLAGKQLGPEPEGAVGAK